MGKSSFGCLLSDEEGRLLAGYRGYLVGVMDDPDIAEAIAFREGLSWLKKLRVSRVHVELNSLTVV